MTKIITINECGQCPYFIVTNFENGCCSKIGIGTNTFKITENELFKDCPLPDKGAL